MESYSKEERIWREGERGTKLGLQHEVWCRMALIQTNSARLKDKEVEERYAMIMTISDN